MLLYNLENLKFSKGTSRAQAKPNQTNKSKSDNTYIQYKSQPLSMSSSIVDLLKERLKDNSNDLQQQKQQQQQQYFQKEESFWTQKYSH